MGRGVTSGGGGKGGMRDGEGGDKWGGERRDEGWGGG